MTTRRVRGNSFKGIPSKRIEVAFRSLLQNVPRTFILIDKSLSWIASFLYLQALL